MKTYFSRFEIHVLIWEVDFHSFLQYPWAKVDQAGIASSYVMTFVEIATGVPNPIIQTCASRFLWFILYLLGSIRIWYGFCHFDETKSGWDSFQTRLFKFGNTNVSDEYVCALSTNQNYGVKRFVTEVRKGCVSKLTFFFTHWFWK